MRPFVRETGVAAPLPMANVDTDMIIPKQFLKTISRAGLAEGLFYDLRRDAEGAPVAGFVLDEAAYRGASILLAHDNFGCGSSREHAPWALEDAGVRCVIAPSFGDIFAANCVENGMAPVRLERDQVDALMAQARGGNATFVVDMEACEVVAPDGTRLAFAIDPEWRRRLLAGEDAIAATLRHEGDIAAFERDRAQSAPEFAG